MSDISRLKGKLQVFNCSQLKEKYLTPRKAMKIYAVV